MSQETNDSRDRLMSDLNRLCDFGGRQSGTASEAAARDWLAEAGADAMGAPCHAHEFTYDGWQARRAELHIDGYGSALCYPLVRSEPTPPEGVEAEVVDLGRGLKDDFHSAGDSLRGKIAMVTHEVMFSTDTFHRRKKMQLAHAAGAAGVLVASREAGQPVAGSARAEEPGLPALGISLEAAQYMRSVPSSARRARMIIETFSRLEQTANLLFDRAGATGKWIVLSAHYDGHSLGESALDNASGVVVCLEVARRIRSRDEFKGHGLRLAFFTVEEWGLLGSQRYLHDLSEMDQADIVLNLNADTVVGGDGLTALTSGFEGLSKWISTEADRVNVTLGIHQPIQANSDYANFARHGIPAVRFVSGFNQPESDVRFVLTGKDTRDLVKADALEHAASFIEKIALSALTADDSVLNSWRSQPDTSKL